MTEALSLSLEAPTSVSEGEFVVAILRVTNTAQAPVEVSARLNLLEGDVRFVISDPSGRTDTVQGAAQVDSGLTTVTLPPGTSIEKGLFLSFTSAGPTLNHPGIYRVKAEYQPTVRANWLESNVVTITVRPPVDEEGRELAKLTRHSEVLRSVALGGGLGDPAAEATLQQVAEKYRGRTEGLIAWLTLAAGGATSSARAPATDSMFTEIDPVRLAHLLTAVTSVMSPRGKELQDTVLTHLSRTETARSSQELERARKIIESQPWR